MKFYITTAIDYLNAPPHIGHALEKVQADVLARYHRLRGDDVFFLTGSDEHGAKIARAAQAAKMEPQKFVDELVEKFKALKDALNLSPDDFIRTTDKTRHWPGVEMMWNKLVEAGDIYKKAYKGLYCVGHESFVTEKDLAQGKCSDHGAEPEVIEEENYFFRLSKYGKNIGEMIKNDELRILPYSRKNEIMSLIRSGLEDVSFSRPRKDLEWGIPVPGDDSQIIYVWCDALTNYLSAIGFGLETSDKRQETSGKNFQKWWPADVHLIGKDILRFHAAIWPGMLLSAGLPLPNNIFVHGFVGVEGKKMSKTLGNVVDPFALVKQYGTDAVRYYLLREIPSHEDGDWGEKKFRERYNGDLANGLGNFASRVMTLGATLENLRGCIGPSAVVAKQIEAAKKMVEVKIAEFKLHEALAEIWKLIQFGDGYINKKKPWDIEHEEDKICVVSDLVVLLDNVAALLLPFLPETAEKITKSIIWEGNNLHVKKIEPLFPRLV
ncbi:MAG: methionine--tRNA ligase [Patescibacteria group bacterium]